LIKLQSRNNGLQELTNYFGKSIPDESYDQDSIVAQKIKDSRRVKSIDLYKGSHTNKKLKFLHSNYYMNNDTKNINNISKF
jgi:hypothetical protein